MWRSSSSSASTPSRMKPPSRARAGGSSTMRRLDRLPQRRSGRRARRRRLRDERRLALAEQQRAPAAPRRATGARATSRAGRRWPARRVDTSRSRSCTALSVSRSLPRSVVAEGELLDRIEPVANRLERHQRAQQPGAQQPAAHGGDRAIDLVRAASPGAPPSDRLDHFQVLERGRIDQQRVGDVPAGDGADVGEVGLLRVAQVAHQRAGGGHGRRRALRGRSRRGVPTRSCSSSVARALAGSKCQPSTSVTGSSARDARAARLARRRPLAHDQLARAQHGDLVLRAPAGASAPVVLGDVELAGREVEQRDARMPPAGVGARRRSRRSPSGTPARARRGSRRR